MADPVSQRLAIQIDGLTGVNPGLASGSRSAYLDTGTWATVASVGRPPSISRAA